MTIKVFLPPIVLFLPCLSRFFCPANLGHHRMIDGLHASRMWLISGPPIHHVASIACIEDSAWMHASTSALQKQYASQGSMCFFKHDAGALQEPSSLMPSCFRSRGPCHGLTFQASMGRMHPCINASLEREVNMQSKGDCIHNYVPAMAAIVASMIHAMLGLCRTLDWLLHGPLIIFGSHAFMFWGPAGPPSC